MTRVMANWEVESDIILPAGTPFVRYDHPGSAYVVFIRPSHEDGAARSTLTLQIIFDAPDLKEARDLSEDPMKEFLDYLTYTSNMRARIGKLQHIFDWEPAAAGSTMRHALYFPRHRVRTRRMRRWSRPFWIR
jgi:hypothetical protein